MSRWKFDNELGTLGSVSFGAAPTTDKPEPGDSPLEALRHTVAWLAPRADDDMVLPATRGVYGAGVETGVSWLDLCQILDWMERSEENLRPDHPAFPTR